MGPQKGTSDEAECMSLVDVDYSNDGAAEAPDKFKCLYVRVRVGVLRIWLEDRRAEKSDRALDSSESGSFPKVI